MAKVNHDRRPNSRVGGGTRSSWRPPLVVGIVGLGALVAYIALNGPTRPHQQPDGTRDMSRREAEAPRTRDGSRKARSPGRAASRRARREGPSDVRETGVLTGRMRTAGSGARRRAALTEEAYEPSHHRSHQLVAELLHVSQSDTVITLDKADEINEILRELGEQGTVAVPAIRDVLRQMEDVDFDALNGGDLVDHSSLRLALFDILSQIGGSEAVGVFLEQLQETRDPVEIALLARNLEAEAPGEYRDELLRAARNALLRAARSPREERADVSPLFEMFQEYGGARVMGDLERNLGAHWWEYSLMALAGMPGGEGVPSLVAQATDPRVKREFPLQMLAQASAQSPEAGEALVDLARSGKIPDSAWQGIGKALEGRHLEFPLQLFDGVSPAGSGGNDGTLSDGEAPQLREYYIEYMNMRYEQRLASANWSDEKIDQQLGLIDELLAVTKNPAAIKALREARATLRGSSG